MNIGTDIYTEEELLKALRANSRDVYYEYTIANTHNVLLGKIPIEDGRISFDSTNEVMRTFTGTTRASNLFDVSNTDFYLTPWMCLKYKNDIVKWPLGKFLVNPSGSYEDNQTIVHIVGYDLAKIALDDKSDSRVYASTSTIYTSLASQIAGSIYTNVDVTVSAKTSPNPLEWGIGTEKLKIINDLLKSISYDPFYFDENGVGQMHPYVAPMERYMDIAYQDDQQSIIIDGLSGESNKFEIANKFIRYVENPDAAYLISTYINNDPNSPYSTVARGRTIVDSAPVNDIATQSDLDNYVRKVAMERMQAVETLVFKTMNMPGHGYHDCLAVNVETYGIQGKYLEVGWEMELNDSGMMTHKCEKVVAL